jgi:hypothetical protein
MRLSSGSGSKIGLSGVGSSGPGDTIRDILYNVSVFLNFLDSILTRIIEMHDENQKLGSTQFK